MLDVLRLMTRRVNEKIDSDEKMKEMAASRDRVIVLSFTDEKDYVIEIKDGKVNDP